MLTFDENPRRMLMEILASVRDRSFSWFDENPWRILIEILAHAPCDIWKHQFPVGKGMDTSQKVTAEALVLRFFVRIWCFLLFGL